MHAFRQIYAAVIIFSVFSVLSAGPAFASDQKSQKTTMKDVKKEMSEFASTLKNYSADQKDEAVQSVKTAMEKVDDRMAALQDRLDQKWDQMDQASREKARDTMNALQRQREDLAEWYGGMKHSSKRAWQKVREGFIKSYETLEASFENAKDEF